MREKICISAGVAGASNSGARAGPIPGPSRIGPSDTENRSGPYDSGRDARATTPGRQHGLSRWLKAGMFLLLFVHRPVPGLAWGDRGHQLINAAAVDNMPQPIRSYFQARKVYLLEHASDPDLLAHDDAAERPHHYTDLDADDLFPFPNLRRQFVLDRAGPMPWQLRNGDSLWQIERFTLELANSLQHRRWQQADHDAVFVAHYAGDLTQPLHTVKNYDGQLTGQKGVHARFETDLVNALADGWQLKPQPAIFVPDLRARIFEEAVASFSSRNLVFAADHIAVSGRTYLDPQYNAVFYKLAGPLAEKRLSAGASFVSSLWYTAWVRAGKPPLPGKPGQKLEASELGVEAALRRHLAR